MASLPMVASGGGGFSVTCDYYALANGSGTRTIMNISNITACNVVIVGNVDISARIQVYDGETLLDSFVGASHSSTGISVNKDYTSLTNGIAIKAKQATSYGGITLTNVTVTA